MYNVTVKRNMDLDFEDAGDLVAQVLQADFEFISKEINELKAKWNTLKPHEVHDWNRNMEVRDAMKTLMSYYMTKRSYDEFMELQRVYGNVV